MRTQDLWPSSRRVFMKQQELDHTPVPGQDAQISAFQSHSGISVCPPDVFAQA